MASKRRWLWRSLMALLSLVGLAVLGGYVYEQLARARDAERFPPPGKLVDVGGFRLHIHCVGDGSPTVVLDTGLGLSSPTWALVQADAMRTTRVCSYDRAGYAWSDAGPEPRTSPVIAAELYTLLERAGERAPFVLVGHSFGGYNVRAFAHAHPEAVAGLVLVDSSHEDQMERMPASMREAQESMVAVMTVVSAASSVGALRPLTGMIDASLGVLPERDPLAAAQARAVFFWQQAGPKSETENFEASARAVRAMRDLGSLPLIVLTAGQSPSSSGPGPQIPAADLQAFYSVWVNELQPDLARLSTRGERKIVAGSEHGIPMLRPDAVVDAIESVVRTVREPPLSSQ